MPPKNTQRLQPPTTTFQPRYVKETPELVKALKGLTMDRCDMEKRYGYHLDQIKSTVLFRRKRCVTCLKLIRSRRANQRTRKVTGGEEEEVIREEVKYFDWWPEDKVQPMIITGGGSLEYVSGGGSSLNPFEKVKDGPEIDMKLEQYYEHGAYAAAMAKPKVEVKRTEQNRRSIIPIQHDTPLLGVHMDRNRPCYVINDTYYNMDLMQWWSHMVPVRWSEYFEKHRGHTTVPKAKCIGHPGDVTGRGWTCCNRPIHSKGCYEDFYHSIPEIDMTEMTKEWELFRTPASALNPHAAVALCCETGVTKTGDPELVRVSMIDFFTGKILINSVVFPKADMLHLNTRWSGVAWSMLYHARKTHTILEGRDHARREVWKFVGPETMVIVHSGGRKALGELRWIHKQVIDTEELESRRKKREQVPDVWKAGLRKLARAHLKRDIENSTFGHDTVESAIACRDLVLWYLENLPEIMKTKVDSSPRAPPNYDEEFWGQLCEAARDNRYVLARNYQVEDGEDDNHREESSEESESELA